MSLDDCLQTKAIILKYTAITTATPLITSHYRIKRLLDISYITLGIHYNSTEEFLNIFTKILSQIMY